MSIFKLKTSIRKGQNVTIKGQNVTIKGQNVTSKGQNVRVRRVVCSLPTCVGLYDSSILRLMRSEIFERNTTQT